MTGEQLSVARARAEAAEVYLRHGLVDDAKWALARLREVLGIAGEPEPMPAASAGGGSDGMTPSPKTRPRATKRAGSTKPRAVASSAERGGTRTKPVGTARRARRKFTETEKKDGAQLGRQLGVKEAAQQLDVADSVLRGWMKSFPAGSSFSSAS